MFFNTDIFYNALGSPKTGVVTEVVLHDIVDSTSTDLMKRLGAGASAGTAVIAARQTGGRGRSGNSWHSANDQNLYISYAIEISGNIADRLPLVPLAAGIAAVAALQKEGISAVLLKWPNDLLLNDKKVGGILCETPGIENDRAVAVVGMGINIGAQAFPQDLQHIAAFLTPSADAVHVRERLSATWIRSLYHWCQLIMNDGVAELITHWKMCCEPFGRYVRVGDVTGYTLDLNDAGRLLLKTDQGEICTVPGGMVIHLD
ncbi:MAG: biotin--[acetyl-CoA-carboxylase] ligase [Deltaproteobacteria bacterium]|nr:biotin--[acetyl-CoA-carboxylase] ligase [Deltaproteobacteria bacterium]